MNAVEGKNMKIKGTDNPKCKLCQYADTTRKDTDIFCTLSNQETSSDNSCKKFLYDIYKYIPQKKPDFSKFSKKDFEL